MGGALVALAPLPATGADWPQFQGPGASGISPETGLARSWPEGGPPALWTLDVGTGFGGAAVQGGEVYLLDRLGDTQDALRCLDLATGRELWRFAYDAPGELPHPGSRQVPSVADRLVYTVGPFGHVQAVDRRTHRSVWSRHLLNDFGGGKVPEWGFAQCPLIYGDTVIVAPQTAKVGVAALDASTGAVRWTSPPVGPNDFCYVTPTRVTLCGVDQVIVLANKKPGSFAPAILTSVEAATGKILWTLETWRTYKLPVSSPVSIGPDRLFVSGAYGLGCFALKTTRDAQAWATAYLFRDNDRCVAHLHPPLLYGGHLYAQSFDIHRSQGNRGLVCLDLDGNLKWQSGPDLLFDAGPLLIADGLIYVLHGKTGELFLLEARPDACRVLARAKVLEGKGGTVWGPMALAGGRLLVRDLNQLRCLDVRGPDVRGPGGKAASQ